MGVAPPRERDVEAYLIAEVERTGGVTRKLKWLCRNGAPDRFVAWPLSGVILVELKAPGEQLRPQQAEEARYLSRHGVKVGMIDSRNAVDVFVALYGEAKLH
jgi:hypothetical protein